MSGKSGKIIDLQSLKSKIPEINNQLESLLKEMNSGLGTKINKQELEKKKNEISGKIEDLRKAIGRVVNKLKNKSDDVSKKLLKEAEAVLDDFNNTFSDSENKLNELFKSIVSPASVGNAMDTERDETGDNVESEVAGTGVSDRMDTEPTDISDEDIENNWLKDPKTWVGAGILGLLSRLGISKYKKWNKERKQKKEEEKRRMDEEKKKQEGEKQSDEEPSEKKDDKKNPQEGNESKDDSGEKQEEKKPWRKRWGIAILGAVGLGTAGYFGYKNKDKIMELKGLNWSGIWDKIKEYGGGVGDKIKGFFEGLFEKEEPLEFDEALSYARGAISNQNNKEGMSYGLNLKYHEDTSEIEAYGEKIKINKDKKMIDRLNVKFKKYENMICAAILIAYLKKFYSGKCTNDSPFSLTGSWQGDINVNTGNGGEEAVDGTGNGGRIVGFTAGGIAGIVAGIYGGLKTGAAVTVSGGIVGYMAGDAFDKNNIMHDLMPELDNENSKKRLEGYLNDMKCRQERNQIKDDITESPIKDKVREVVDTIQKENPDLPAVGGRMNYDAIQDTNDKSKYTIKAYNREITAEVTGSEGNEKMKILGISGGVPAIKTDMTKGKISEMNVPLKEGLYMTALLGRLLDEYSHKGKYYPYFNINLKPLSELTQYAIMEKVFDRLNGKSLEEAMTMGGLYLNDTKFTINVLKEEFWSKENWVPDSLVYPAYNMAKNMPSIFKDNGENFLEFLNDGITDENNVSIRKK